MSRNVEVVKSPPHIEFLAGLGSAFLTIIITYPITKLIYRQILENQKAIKSFKNIKQEGHKFLFRGALPPMLQRCVSISTMFGVYRAAKIPLEKLQMNEYVEKICACFITGTFESIFMPLERIQILLISSSYNKKFRNMFHVTQVIANEYTLREFYRGFNIILVRNATANLCFFTAKEEFQNRFRLSEVAYRQSAQHFIFGASLGTLMTFIFYPVKVIKVNMHKQLGGKYKSIREVAKEIYNKNNGGVINFYRGMFVNGFRALFAWGITNSSYEYIKKHIQ